MLAICHQKQYVFTWILFDRHFRRNGCGMLFLKIILVMVSLYFISFIAIWLTSSSSSVFPVSVSSTISAELSDSSGSVTSSDSALRRERWDFFIFLGAGLPSCEPLTSEAALLRDFADCFFPVLGLAFEVFKEACFPLFLLTVFFAIELLRLWRWKLLAVLFAPCYLLLFLSFSDLVI